MLLDKTRRDILVLSQSRRKNFDVPTTSALSKMYGFWEDSRGKPYGKRENLCHFFWVIVLFTPLWAIHRMLAWRLRITDTVKVPIGYSVLGLSIFGFFTAHVGLDSLASGLLTMWLASGFFITLDLWIYLGHRHFGRYYAPRNNSLSGIDFIKHPRATVVLAVFYAPITIVMGVCAIALTAIAQSIKAVYHSDTYGKVVSTFRRHAPWLNRDRMIATYLVFYGTWTWTQGNNVLGAIFLFFAGCILLLPTLMYRVQSMHDTRSAARAQSQLDTLLGDPNFNDYVTRYHWYDIKRTSDGSIPDQLRATDIYPGMWRVIINSYIESLDPDQSTRKPSHIANAMSAAAEILGVFTAWVVYAKRTKACPFITVQRSD